MSADTAETGSASGTATGSRGGTSSSISLESVAAIAKKDFRDAVRSWLFWGLSAVFFAIPVALALGIVFFGSDVSPTQEATTEGLVILISQATRLLIPLIALVLGWKAIAGERESGSIKILLSLPHSRKDVILGKLLGRSAVLSLSLVLGFALGGIAVALVLGTFSLTEYVGLLVVSILYGVAYTSIAVSLSSLTRSSTVAGGAMFGVFVLFYVIWNLLPNFFAILGNQGVPFLEPVSYTAEIQGQEVEAQRFPEWVYFVLNLDPGEAYNRSLTLVTDSEFFQLLADLDAVAFGGELPFFLQDWFGVVVLLFWIVVPTVIALYRFDRVDL